MFKRAECRAARWFGRKNGSGCDQRGKVTIGNRIHVRLGHLKISGAIAIDHVLKVFRPAFVDGQRRARLAADSADIAGVDAIVGQPVHTKPPYRIVGYRCDQCRVAAQLGQANTYIGG